MKKLSQYNRILLWLKKGHTITPLQALRNYGCLRLGARIFEMKEAGYNIETKFMKVGENCYVAKYRLIK